MLHHEAQASDLVGNRPADLLTPAKSIANCARGSPDVS
jgi:hypothetical protein